MKEVNIIAKSKKGKEALRQHIEESKKLRLLHRITFRKLGYKQIITSEEPLTLCIEINNPYFQMVLKPKKFTAEIVSALDKNGAKENIDYKLEVK